MKNERIHSMLLALVGGYLLYLAWQLFDKYRTGTEEMPEAVFLLAIGIFTIAGIGVLFFAWTVYQKTRKEEKQQSEDPEGVSSADIEVSGAGKNNPESEKEISGPDA